MSTSWDTWGKVDLSVFDETEHRSIVDRIKAAIVKEYDDAPFFVLKDPRLSLLVSLYLQALTELGVVVKTILPIRNPLAVADSLMTRNNMDRAQAMLIWLRYVLDMENGTRATPRSVVSFETLMEDWCHSLTTIGVHLDVSWPNPIEAVAHTVEEFINPDLRHHLYTNEHLHEQVGVSDWVKTTYAALLALTERPDDKNAMSELERVRIEFNKCAATFNAAYTGELARREEKRLRDIDELESRLLADLSKQKKMLLDKSKQALKRSQIAHEEALEDLESRITQQTNNVLTNEIDTLKSHLVSANQQLLAALHTILSNQRAYPSIMKAFTRLKRLFVPSRILTSTLIPDEGLESTGPAYGWRSTSTDPRFYLPISCTNTFIRVRFRASLSRSRPTYQPFRWQLFYDCGNGYSENHSHVVHLDGNLIDIDEIIQLPAPAIQFRMDPVEEPCEFVLENFQMEALSGITTGLNIALRKILRTYKDGHMRLAVKRAVGLALSGQFQLIVQKMFRTKQSRQGSYEDWILQRTITPELTRKMAAKIEKMELKPFFSVIMPTYNSRIEFLDQAVQSIQNQIYPHWELCIADDGSPDPSVRKHLQKLAAKDSRIRIKLLEKNCGISGASNAALALAKGDFIALLDHDDEYEPHALFALALEINKDPKVDWIYTDEDKVDENGKRFGSFFKPDWSPAYFLSCMYACHLVAYRKSLIDKLGGFRSDFDLAQDYDLALRVATETQNIRHISDILYHWRTLPESTASGADAKPEAELAARRAVQDFVDCSPYSGTVIEGPLRGTHRVKFDIQGDPLVSIAIPSAGYTVTIKGEQSWYVLELIKSIRTKTTYKNLEIVIADNDDFDPELTKALKKLNVEIVHYKNNVFNLSEKMNFVVEATSGEYVIILNDDMTLITENWIEEMLMWCQQDGVAGVGAKLLFPTDQIQHAGVVLLGYGPSHPYYLHDKSEVGLVCGAIVPKEHTAVTGACMMVRRKDYLAIGGFDPKFRILYNDVDFCLRLRDHTSGQIVQSPYAQLYHYESVSAARPSDDELKRFNKKWSHLVGHDPFYNVNLSPTSNCFELNPLAPTIVHDYDL